MESSASFCANPSICSLACKRSMLISRFCEKLSRMSRSALLRCDWGRNKSGRHQAAAQRLDLDRHSDLKGQAHRVNIVVLVERLDDLDASAHGSKGSE